MADHPSLFTILTKNLVQFHYSRVLKVGVLNLLLMGAAVNQPSVAHTQHLAKKPAAPEAEPESIISSDALQKYKAESGCDGDAYKAIQVALSIEQLDFEIKKDHLLKYTLEAGQLVAADQNRLAQVAEDKGCATLAKSLFLNVIEIYVGSGFAAMRERAEIGLMDLRDTRPSPGNQPGPIASGTK